MYFELTQKQIEEMHNYVIIEDGGLQGTKDPGYLGLIIDKPFQEAFGQELYPGLFLKAAVYMHGLATAHAFFDGNKRTAVLACITFLGANGKPLKAEPDELYNVAISVATHELDLYALADWLEAHT